jgi:outer membrane protein assembly factor BamE
MRTSFSRAHRIPAITGALSLLLAATLTGCASKNPLMDEPAVAAKPAEIPAQASAAAPADASIASGVTTTGPTGTQRVLGILAPYRVNIQQGNFISREMVTQLKESMQRSEGVTREQVRFVLGTPLLTDMFHAERWDYVFRLRKGTGETISSRVTVYFKDNRLVKIDGGALPTEQEYLAYIAGAAPGAAPAK